MVIHFKVDGHRACGHKDSRKNQCNEARRAARQSWAARSASDWRSEWIERLTAMAGLQRLPRGFSGQTFV